MIKIYDKSTLALSLLIFLQSDLLAKISQFEFPAWGTRVYLTYCYENLCRIKNFDCFRNVSISFECSNLSKMVSTSFTWSIKYEIQSVLDTHYRYAFNFIWIFGNLKSETPNPSNYCLRTCMIFFTALSAGDRRVLLDSQECILVRQDLSKRLL